MEIQPFHTKVDYKAALKVISALIDLDPQRFTPEGDRLEIPGILVEAHDRASQQGLRGTQWQAQAHHGNGLEAAYRAWHTGRKSDSTGGLTG
jgi:hypothetical protein